MQGNGTQRTHDDPVIAVDARQLDTVRLRGD